MDHNRFDNLTRSISGTSTRRRFSGTMAALGLGSLASFGLLGADEVDAKRKGNKKQGKGKKVTVCHNGQEIRVAKRALKKHLRHGDTQGACPIVEPPCIPDCEGPFGPKFCGDDGCGGTCGTCPLLKPICNNILFTCETII
jgi:hypothetical protein